MSCDQELSSCCCCCCCDFPAMMECTLELWVKINPFSLKLLLPDYFVIATEKKMINTSFIDLSTLLRMRLGEIHWDQTGKAQSLGGFAWMCSVNTSIPGKKDRKCACCSVCHLMLPPSLFIQKQMKKKWEKNPRAPRHSDEPKVSSQKTGNSRNFPPNQKPNEVQTLLPKHSNALLNSGNHHQIKPKSQNRSNMLSDRSLLPFYEDLSPNIHLCPQTNFQNLPNS